MKMEGVTARWQSRCKELGGSHMHQREKVNSTTLKAFRSGHNSTNKKSKGKENIDCDYYMEFFQSLFIC